MSSANMIDQGPYVPSIEDVFVFKMVTGEEVISLMHPSEKVKKNEFDPFMKLEKPLVFRQSTEGFSATDWCPWSPDRIFLLPVQSALIVQEAQPHMAEMYFKDMFPENAEKESMIQLVGSPDSSGKTKKILTKGADVVDFRPK